MQWSVGAKCGQKSIKKVTKKQYIYYFTGFLFENAKYLNNCFTKFIQIIIHAFPQK